MPPIWPSRIRRVIVALAVCVCGEGRASLADYDALIAAEAGTGLVPTARLTEAVTFPGNQSVPFNFGPVSGDGTFECIVEATGQVSSGYLAVGANTLSNLRLQQYNNTGELGMTQLGVADYRFTPGVPAPVAPTHLAWVWDGAGTMRLFVNGTPAGIRTGVAGSFALPAGAGRLGANPSNGEGMSGTLYRVTCYDSMLDEAALLRRGEAWQGRQNPPVIQSFTATPAAVSHGSNVTLAWSVRGADSLTINGTDVRALTSMMVTPASSSDYTLTAVNAHGTSTRTVRVAVVQPAGHVVINEFMAANRSTLLDEDGDFSDWLELYNPTASPVFLGGFFLTDKSAQPALWSLPAVDLAAGGYRLIFLSGKNRTPAFGEWHAGFSLNKDGEYLALTNMGGIVHQFAPVFPPQEDDLSFGLTGGDPALAGYLGQPTPGAANDASLPRPARVNFSSQGGLLRHPVDVVLSCVTPGAEIRYQLNSSAVQTYHGPLTITTSSRLRTWAEKHGQPGQETKAAWVKLAPDLASYSSPLPILVMDNFGSGPVPQKGWSGNGAGIQQVPRQDAAWLAWEKVEGTAATTGEPQFFSRIGLRGRGAFSSSWRQKPYTVEAWDAAGEETEISVLGMPAHADWILYFPDPDDNKDPTLLFNTFVYDLSRKAGRDAPRFRWGELFLNEDGGEVSLTDRRGVYAVLEKVSRGPGRLDFEKLSEDGSQGGWLLNLNRMDAIPESGWPAANGSTTPQFFRTAGANRLQETQPNQPAVAGDDQPQQSNGFLNFDNPNGYQINPLQRNAVEGWFRQFEDVLYNNSVWRDPAAGYRQWLDDRDFAEYFIFNELTRNGDGMLISMFPWKGDDGRLRMGPTWDYNWSSYYIGGGATGNLRWRGDRIWYGRLFADPDFLQLYTDRWFAFRKGPMSNSGMAAIIDAQAAEITPAKAVAQGISSATVWQNRLNQMKTWLANRADWVDAQYVRPPQLSVPGGIVAGGQPVALTVPAGTLYYTTDGSDPRASGGAPAAGAGTGNSLTISHDMDLTVRARVSANRWSAPTTARYVTDAVPASALNLQISEIHYHPASPSAAEQAAGFTDGDDFEFIECYNPGPEKISLAGVRLSFAATGDNTAFPFDGGTIRSLVPGGRLVLVNDAAAFAHRYGPAVPVAGEYTGKLINSGGTIVVWNAEGGELVRISYLDHDPWPAAADGSGRSLTLLSSTAPAQAGAPAAWRSSVEWGGSPGTSDSLPLPPDGDLIRYVFGGAPASWSWENGVATVRQPRVPGSDAVSVGMEVSNDLRTWHPSGAAEADGRLEPDGSLVLERTLPASGHGFIRWRITLRL